MQSETEEARQSADTGMVTVWDPAVRLFHWTLVVTFFVAYLTEDDLLTVHVWAGYAVGGIVLLRFIWGFVGPQHARFTDFVFGPLTVWSYLLDLLSFGGKRYLGHSPAGGAMVLALLAGLAATVWSGLETYAIEENAGPLAAAAAPTASPDSGVPRIFLASRERNEEHERGERDENGEDGFWEEAHEILANFTLILVVLHIAGVALASLVHRENLVRAMINGKKRAG